MAQGNLFLAVILENEAALKHQFQFGGGLISLKLPQLACVPLSASAPGTNSIICSEPPLHKNRHFNFPIFSPIPARCGRNLASLCSSLCGSAAADALCTNWFSWAQILSLWRSDKVEKRKATESALCWLHNTAPGSSVTIDLNFTADKSLNANKAICAAQRK